MLHVGCLTYQMQHVLTLAFLMGCEHFWVKGMPRYLGYQKHELLYALVHPQLQTVLKHETRAPEASAKLRTCRIEGRDTDWHHLLLGSLPDSQNVLSQSSNLSTIGVLHYECHVLIVKLTRFVCDRIVRLVSVASRFHWSGHVRCGTGKGCAAKDLKESRSPSPMQNRRGRRCSVLEKCM